jgi:uncharacterized membrane protein
MIHQDVIKLHPRPGSLDREAARRCIEECLDCAATCTACADDSLGEDDAQGPTRVIRLAVDCADICDTTRRIVIRQTAPDIRVIRAMIEACSAACLACAEECDRHAGHHEHCRLCAEVCRRCKQACDGVLATMS